MKPYVSIIIPTYNNARIIIETLSTLQCHTTNNDKIEVLIIDDGSTDDTKDTLSTLQLPRYFQYIYQLNLGAAVARNYGARLSQGNILIFLDSDVVPDQQWLSEHIDTHHRHPDALVVGRTRPMSAPKNNIFYQVMACNIFEFDHGDKECYLSFQDVVSRNLSMPKAIFTELGGFDERYPSSGFEDTEFALRAIQAGYKILYSPTASGEHRHFGTLEQVGQHMYNYQISAAMLFSQHPEARGQIPHLIDKESISWGNDSPFLIARKVMRWLFAKQPVQLFLRFLVKFLEVVCPSKKLLKTLYWQVLGSYLYLGYREGRKRYQLD